MFNLRRRKDNRGFSLVEVLVASSIFIVVSGIMLSIYIAGNETWETARYRANLQAQARIALDYMVSELMNTTRTSAQNPSPNLSIPSTPNNKSIIFYLPADKDNNGLITDSGGNIEWGTDNPIHYQYVPGQKILRRLEQGQQTILAQNVSDVQFIDMSIDPTLYRNELKMTLGLKSNTPRQREVAITLTTIVMLRN